MLLQAASREHITGHKIDVVLVPRDRVNSMDLLKVREWIATPPHHKRNITTQNLIRYWIDMYGIQHFDHLQFTSGAEEVYILYFHPFPPTSRPVYNGYRYQYDPGDDY